MKRLELIFALLGGGKHLHDVVADGVVVAAAVVVVVVIIVVVVVVATAVVIVAVVVTVVTVLRIADSDCTGVKGPRGAEG